MNKPAVSDTQKRNFFDWDWDTKFIRLKEQVTDLPPKPVPLNPLMLRMIDFHEIVTATMWCRRTQLKEDEFRAQIDLLLYHDIVAPVDDC
ncbi:hypothetical protein [Cerasicoccus maritimus]|uniref:hypothetical protein n=1 Tax=Cerasicoccus maritimus TaxID=490089 RepID=UPI0028529198|nr:hypothetical protein [Cerasicoccus maritimus]